jgi:hypothetical protein
MEFYLITVWSKIIIYIVARYDNNFYRCMVDRHITKMYKLFNSAEQVAKNKSLGPAAYE